MHKNFGEWYRLVSIEPTDEILQKRWAGVEAWVSSIRGDDDALLETARLFRALPGKTTREAFLTTFRTHDAAFAQRNNELEQRVLAGAALAQCVIDGKDVDESGLDGVRAAVLAGTAVEASGLWASQDPLEEVTGEVLAGLCEIAKDQRRRSSFSTVLFRPTEEKALNTTLEQIASAADHAQLRPHVSTAFQKILEAVRRAESALNGATHDLRCADEETNILWWLAGGSSRDLNKRWGALKDAVPLVAGFELADLTDVALGPQDAAALLERMVPELSGGSTEQPLHVYVDAVPAEWANARVAKFAGRAVDLTPLSLALSHRSKSSTGVWQTFFEASSGLKATTTLPPGRAARLAYVEAVLLCTLAKAES